MDLLTTFYLEENPVCHFGEALRLQEIKASMGGGQDYSCGEPQRGVLGLRALVKRTCPLLYKRVELQGLNTPALNGTRGIAFDFSYTERRFRGIMQMLSIPGSWWVIASGRYSVVLDVPGRTLSFGVNGGPIQTAASRLHERGGSPRVHAVVYLTDVSSPMEGVPVNAEVEVRAVELRNTSPVQPTAHSPGRKFDYGSPKYTHDYSDYGR